MPNLFKGNISEHIAVINELFDMADHIENIAEKISTKVKNGSCVFWMGNGGSAADSQHLAAELIGRFKLERKSIPSIALHTDSSILTCLSNDYGYEIVFSRQIEAYCNPNDVVIGLSTSGNSKNVLNGVKAANDIGAFTLGITGENGGELKKHCQYCISVPSNDTARIQEAHILIGHTICQIIERDYAEVVEQLEMVEA